MCTQMDRPKINIQIIQSIHDQFLYRFHSIIEFGVGTRSPDVRFTHAQGDELYFSASIKTPFREDNMDRDERQGSRR